MLKMVPFYGSLLKQPLTTDTKASDAHVLLYGAVEVHDFGPKGCIASNNRLAQDIGRSSSRVASLLSELAAAGWVTITKKKDGSRDRIIPNGTIKMEFVKPLPNLATPLAKSGNIGNSEETILRKGASADAPEENPIYREFWKVVRFYALANQNAKNIRKWSDDLVTTHGKVVALAYLERLQDRDLRVERETQEFVPQLATAYDVYVKSTKIIDYFTRTKVAVDPRSYE